MVALDHRGATLYTDWSFSQLCTIAGVAKETVNRLRPQTAAQVLAETFCSPDQNRCSTK